MVAEFDDGGDVFDFSLTVMPHEGGNKRLRFRVFPEWLDDGAPYRADVRFDLSQSEAETFASELKVWCAKPDCAFVWKSN